MCGPDFNISELKQLFKGARLQNQIRDRYYQIYGDYAKVLMKQTITLYKDDNKFLN